MVQKSVYVQPEIAVRYLVEEDVFLDMSTESSWPWGDDDVTEGGNDF